MRRAGPVRLRSEDQGRSPSRRGQLVAADQPSTQRRDELSAAAKEQRPRGSKGWAKVGHGGTPQHGGLGTRPDRSRVSVIIAHESSAISTPETSTGSSGFAPARCSAKPRDGRQAGTALRTARRPHRHGQQRQERSGVLGRRSIRARLAARPSAWPGCPGGCSGAPTPTATARLPAQAQRPTRAARRPADRVLRARRPRRAGHRRGATRAGGARA